MANPAIALQAVTDAELASATGISAAHARKIIASVHRDQALSPRPGLPRSAIDRVTGLAHTPALELVRRDRAEDGFHKLLFRGGFEAVRIPLERSDRVTVCVSSQVGCALACSFCATGRLGLSRNLEPWEIIEQVRAVKRDLPPGVRAHGVVFQGMGEPMANLDRVLRAIAVLTAPYAGAIDARAITVSTAGLPDGIRRLAREAPRVRLGLSIGSARPDLRGELMPITRAHTLDSVLDAAVDHARATGISPMWAVTLLRDVNDSDDDARALTELADRFRDRAGLAPRITVLAYNRIDGDQGDPFRTSSEARTDRFRDQLAAGGFHSHRRYSGGGGVRAACGQLARAELETSG